MTESANDGCVIEGDSAETKEVEGKYQRKEVKFGPIIQSCNTTPSYTLWHSRLYLPSSRVVLVVPDW